MLKALLLRMDDEPVIVRRDLVRSRGFEEQDCAKPLLPALFGTDKEIAAEVHEDIISLIENEGAPRAENRHDFRSLLQCNTNPIAQAPNRHGDQCPITADADHVMRLDCWTELEVKSVSVKQVLP